MNKGIRAAMRTYEAKFAFTYRFPYAGERAGETRAEQISR
jgi:hypothetical protein